MTTHTLALPVGEISNALRDSRGGEMLAITVKQLPVDRIRPDPEQPRRAVEQEGPEWAGLLASVAKHGVLQSILVRPDDAQRGCYILVCGERRWRAARALGHSHITARVIRDQAMLAARAEIQLLENSLREDLSPLDEMDACLHLLNTTGMEKQELARLMGVSPPVVSDIVKLDRIDPEVRAEIRCRNVNIPRRQLLRIAKLPDHRAQQALLANILHSGQEPPAIPDAQATTQVLVGRNYHCNIRFGKPPDSARSRKRTARPIRLSIRGGCDANEVADALRRAANELAPAQSGGDLCLEKTYDAA